MTYGFSGGSTTSNAGRYGGSSSNTASTSPSRGTTSANSAGRYGGGGASTTSSKSAGGTTSANSAGRYGGGATSSKSSPSSFGGSNSPRGMGSSTGATSSKTTGGGSTASNAGRYGGPTSNVARSGGDTIAGGKSDRVAARAATPALSAGSGAYAGPSTATPTSYSPDLSSRTRMGSVTFGGPKAAPAPTTGLSSLLSRATTTPTSTFSPANPTQPTGFNTAITAGMSAENARRADLAQQARAAENASMADYASEITGPASVHTVGLAEQRRASEAQSMADLGSLKESYRVAIAGRETEGVADPYGKVHPGVPQKNGTVAHALGKYGVMDYNVGPWTKEVFGVPMTAKDFLANPKAQDAVFDAKIGQYVAKTGSFEKAAQAWYGGLGSVGKPNNAPPKGVAGPTVGVYAADALARQTNAYASLKDQNRTTQVAGTDPSSDVESRANEAGRKARADVQAAAEAAGEDPMSPEVQRRGDIASNEAYDNVKAGATTTQTAAQDEPAQPAQPAQTQPAPAQPTTPDVSLPQRAPKPTSRDAPPYQRSPAGYVKAAGIDVLTSLTPFGLPAQIASLLFTGDTVGGNAADAMGGKFGENYASPERNTPMRGLGSGGDRFSDQTSAASNSASSTGQCPKGWHYDPDTKRCVKDDTTAASTFEDKYLGGGSSFDDTGRPTPEQKWDWTSSKYIGVANAPSI